METNEIKKELYKQNPIAHMRYVRKNYIYYFSSLEQGMGPSLKFLVEFKVPISDIGDADFLPEMEAKLLIRWLV